MKTFGSVAELKQGASVANRATWNEETVDTLAATAALATDPALKAAAIWTIRAAAQDAGAIPSSIQSLYDAIGTGKIRPFSVPAINVRGMTYDFARSVFRAALKGNVGAVLFEIAKSEIGYTDQRPPEYAASVLAAAVRENWRGPVFIQGDHFQFNAKKFAENRETELKGIKDLTKEAIDAGFYNIDIDASTLVDLSQPTVREQQRNNFEMTAEMTRFVRSIEPKGITVSVGGEIGEVGGKNSTVEEFREFMGGYRSIVGQGSRGISKISVQTGTSHGGIPLPDGTVAKVKLDFATLESISKVARAEYGLSGCVQHGASTLPEELFDKFPATGTAEIHLATEFQNMIYECAKFPAPFKQKIYDHLKTVCASERKSGQTDEQFYYTTRKKGFGPFKKDFWGLDRDVKAAVAAALEAKFDKLFTKLAVKETWSIVADHVKPVKYLPPAPSQIA